MCADNYINEEINNHNHDGTFSCPFVRTNKIYFSGGISLSESKRSVLAKYGEPDERDCDKWIYDFKKCIFTVQFDDDGVKKLSVSGELDRASSFKTRLGVRVGDKEATLIKAYGKGTLEYDGSATRLRMYPNLNTYIGTDNKIYLIEVYKS